MTSISQLTEEEKYFARFFFLNFKVSPDIVRRFFDGVFPPAQLPQTINYNTGAIMRLNKSKIISNTQLEILRAIPGTVWPSYLPAMPVGGKATSSKDFDLTLMICLLRNIGNLKQPSKGWDQLPNPNDMSPGANLATLKWYRNKLAHTTVTSMDKNDFTDKWTRVEKALTSLNIGNRPTELNEILNYDLDGEQAKTFANAELKQMKKEYMDCEKEKEQIESDFSHYKDGNLPKNYAEANTSFVEAWRKEDESFYETEGSELVYDKVQDSCCILVTSNSGLGKTATIRHIALKLQPEGFEIVSIESPDDIIKYKTNQKQVFLIDDVLGKYALSPTLLEKWERINEKLMNCLETELGSKKLLCTLRLQIARHKRFKNASTILNKEVIDLESESYALSKDEKKKILIEHLKKKNLEKEIKNEEVEIMCQTNYAFPLLCKLVSNDKERFKNRIAFFRQPLVLLRDELEQISNQNKKLYCILVICMLNNGTISKGIFHIDSDDYDDKIYRIMETCGLERNMHKKNLEDSALSAIGSYFTEDSWNFHFIHDALAETICCHFYTFDSRVMFSDCDILFIRDRVRVHFNENINDNTDENIIFIHEDKLNEDCLSTLYDRMWTELNNGRFSNLLMSHLFKNRNFVRIFGSHSESYGSKLGPKYTFMNIVSSERNESSDGSFFEKMFKIKSVDELHYKKNAISRVIEAVPFRSTLLYWIVAFGCDEFFQYAWSEITTLDRNSILGTDFTFLPTVKSFFPLAVLGGSLQIVKELIGVGEDVSIVAVSGLDVSVADVNCFSECCETPLYIAVKSCRFDMARLLVNNGAKVNLRGWFTMNVPIMVTSNNNELTSLILEHDLSQTDLHKAVLKNDLNILKSNIRSENINSKTKSGWTILHYAVICNNLEAVKVLFPVKMPQNDEPYSEINSVDERTLLCRKTTLKIDMVDNNGLTAVHLAVMNNNTEILSVLLCNKAEVNVRDVLDRTPLHYTTSESVTKLLLTHTYQNQCIKPNQITDEMRDYEIKPMSAFRSMCSNLTLQNSFRNVCRDFVNSPDREGNTPLHSVVNRCRLTEESQSCIDTMIMNGANPYLSNDSGFSAFELIKSNCDTSKYINNYAKYEKLGGKIYKVFASVMFCLLVVTFVVTVQLSSIIRNEVLEGYFCNGQVVESSNSTIRISVIIHTIPFIWLLLITFYMRYSDLLQQCFCLCALLVVLGCVLSLLFGAFEYIQIICRFMYLMFIAFLIFSMNFKFMAACTSVPFVRWNKGKVVFLIISATQFILLFLLLTLLSATSDLKFDDFYNMINIQTLNKIVFNCIEYSPANISCTSLTYNGTYDDVVDFSVQCFTDSNITSYNGTYGTPIVEPGYIDWSEIGLVSLFCFNFSLNATCAYCLFHCILVPVMKMFKGKSMYPIVYLVQWIFYVYIYIFISCISFFTKSN
ncbi:uncharacterized protein LOC134722999 [Mytilus trossulus]|uniref:uncharacterized protein LOC134722999 n=1 Tax=Mytilus trossulus TaxID=6551 RepID=UPI0030050C79